MDVSLFNRCEIALQGRNGEERDIKLCFFKTLLKKILMKNLKFSNKKILKIMIKNIIPTMFQLKNLRII